MTEEETTATEDNATSASDGPSMQKIEHLLAECVEYGHKKSAGRGRVRDTDAEQCKAKWARTAAYCARTIKLLREARQLEEMDERLSALEEPRERAGEQTDAERAEALLDEAEELVGEI